MLTVKNRRKAISLERKIQILDHLATGEGSTAVGRYFDISEATVRSIKKNELAIRTAVYTGSDLNAKSAAYTKDVYMVKMEAALNIWIEENKRVNQFPLDGITIKTIALMIYNQIKENENQTEKNDLEIMERRKHDFSASNGWLRGFLKRNALDHIKMRADTAIDCVNITDKEFKEKLNDIIKRSCILNAVRNKEADTNVLQQIYRINEKQKKRMNKQERKEVDTLSNEITNYMDTKKSIKFDVLSLSSNDNDDKADEESKSRKITAEHLYKINKLNKVIKNETKQSEKHQRANKRCNNEDCHDPLYMNFIEEGAKLANEVCEHFLNHDWNKKRAKDFQRDMKSLIKTYYSL